MLSSILWNTIGGGAVKAIFGGVASAVTTSGAIAMGACDLTTIGEQAGAVIGAYVIGHIVTWIAPKNKPSGGLY